MQPRRLLVVIKNTVILKKETFDLLRTYTDYFIRTLHAKLDDYIADHHVQSNDPHFREEQATITQAVEVHRALTEFPHETRKIYKWNFEKLAEVFRKARIALGLTRIEDMYSLKVTLTFLMEMLGEENPMFDREHFITYINEGGTTQ